MDNEMIERLVTIQMKHSPQTNIGAAIVIVELLTAMREPTEKMIMVGFNKPNDFQHGEITVCEIHTAMIDAILGNKE